MEEFFKPIYGLELDPYLAKEDLQGIHHLARYHWVKNVLKEIKPKKILDIACGAGYGTYMIAKQFPDSSIVGIDYDQYAIEVSQSSYILPNLIFQRGDMVSWTRLISEQEVNIGKQNAVISFDTIEHINHREIALLRIVENLEEDGIFILSTPISFPVTKLKPNWEAHKVEYGSSDLLNLLKHFFHKVLIPEDGTLPYIEFWKEIINHDKNRYLNITNPIFCQYPKKT